MNNKILIGSIISIIILVSVSFTSVVGYNKLESNIGVSPLFNIRTNRAIDEESIGMSCEFVGKGTQNPITIFQRDNRTELFQKFFKRIIKMDYLTFERFIVSIINYALRSNRFNDINPDNIRETLYKLRYSENPIPIFDNNIKYKNNFRTVIYLTECCQTKYGGIGGLLVCIVAIIFLPFILIINRILTWYCIS